MAKLTKNKLLKAMLYLRDEIDRLQDAVERYDEKDSKEWREIMEIDRICFEACKMAANSMKEEKK